MELFSFLNISLESWNHALAWTLEPSQQYQLIGDNPFIILKSDGIQELS
jgi:hypothetical protein